MYLSTKTDLSNLKTESTYQPDMSINPLSAAIRGVGAGLSLAPTVLEFATRDAEPLFDEPPTLFDRPIEFARSAAKGTIAPIIDNLAQSASEFRARQDEALVQSGIVSQVAYGVPYVLAGYVASGASPVSLGVGLGEARRQQEIRRGVDEETAATIGAVEGVVGAVGAAIPLALGKGMVQRFGFGVAANVIPGMAQRAAEQQVYGVRYADRAPDVLDPVAIAVDAVLGGAFGYLAGRMDTAVDVEAVNEALRTNIDVRTADAAPGAMTPQAFGIHNKMVTETIQAKAEGREPDYRPILEAEFRDSPEQMRNFEESLSAITAGRMVEDRPVYDSILDQIRPMYSEADARVNAKVASMAYTALAKRMGMTPEDLLSDFPVKIVLEATDGLIKDVTQNNGVAPRGAYDPAARTISLMDARDSSTFIHELGHHTLEMLGKLAADPKAPKQIKDDFATLMKRGGMKVEDWYTSDINTRRSAHETIADDFENYFATGQAPSLELNGIFRVVRDWMLGVYKTIRGEVQPEVRAVFDRMLATDEQIAMKSQVVDYLAVAERTQQLSQSSVDDNIEAARNALDPEVEVVIDGVRVKPDMLVDETPVEVDAMVKLKECLLNVR